MFFLEEKSGFFCTYLQDNLVESELFQVFEDEGVDVGVFDGDGVESGAVLQDPVGDVVATGDAVPLALLEGDPPDAKLGGAHSSQCDVHRGVFGRGLKTKLTFQ